MVATMSPSIFLDYPFTFSSIVSIELEPRSEIDNPDKIISLILEESRLFDCIIGDKEHLDKDVSDAIKIFGDIDFTIIGPNVVKMLQKPKSVSQEELYQCEVTFKGVFTLNATIKPYIAKKMIEFLIVNRLVLLGDLEDITENLFGQDFYEDYQAIIEDAYDSIQFLSKDNFQVSEPVRT